MNPEYQSPEVAHLKEKVILDEINSADLHHALEIMDNLGDAIEADPQILEDEQIKIHLNAVIRRLNELGHDIIGPDEEEQTVH